MTNSAIQLMQIDLESFGQYIMAKDKTKVKDTMAQSPSLKYAVFIIED